MNGQQICFGIRKAGALARFLHRLLPFTNIHGGDFIHFSFSKIGNDFCFKNLPFIINRGITEPAFHIGKI